MRYIIKYGKNLEHLDYREKEADYKKRIEELDNKNIRYIVLDSFSKSNKDSLSNRIVAFTH